MSRKVVLPLPSCGGWLWSPAFSRYMYKPHTAQGGRAVNTRHGIITQPYASGLEQTLRTPAKILCF